MGTSLLKLDIDDLLNKATSNNGSTSVSVIIHTTDDDIEPELFEDFVVIRDYINNVTDYTVLTVHLGLGDIYYNIYPYRGNLEATITIKNLDKDGKEYRITERCKCVLLNHLEDMESPIYKKMSKDDLNNTGITKLQIQCYLREYEAIRNLPAACNTTNSNVEKAMQLALSRVSLGEVIKIDGNPLEYNIDIRKPDNDEIYSKLQIDTTEAIPNLLDFPSYLQKYKGVYNGHIGTYMQRYNSKNDNSKTVFVYPLIDYDLFDTSDNNCIIYLPVDLNVSKFSDKTYYQDGDSLKILAADVTKMFDKSKYETLNKGSGIAYTHPREILSRGMITLDEDGKANYDRNESVKEQSLGTLDDGTNNIVYKGMSTNNFIDRSLILENNLLYMNITWRFSNPDLIYPCMPVNVYQEEPDGNITIFKGNLLRSFSFFSNVEKSFSTSLTMSLVRKEKK